MGKFDLYQEQRIVSSESSIVRDTPRNSYFLVLTEDSTHYSLLTTHVFTFLTASAIQLILQQPAINLTGIKFNSAVWF